MVDASLSKKLLIKIGQKIAIVNAPPGYLDRLMPLPDGVQLMNNIKSPLDFVQVFTSKASELNNLVPEILKALKPEGLLWVCYPKGGDRIKTDLNRDTLRKAMEKFGQAGVSLVSIDSVW